MRYTRVEKGRKYEGLMVTWDVFECRPLQGWNSLPLGLIVTWDVFECAYLAEDEIYVLRLIVTWDVFEFDVCPGCIALESD